MIKFSVGGATITQLTEFDVWRVSPREWYPDLTDEQIGEICRRYAPWAAEQDGSALIFALHNYVVEVGDTVIVVDTCAGNHKPRLTARDLHMLQTDYLTRFKAAGYSPDNVDIVLNTHLHPDHSGWNTRLIDKAWAPSFPNATYLFHSRELDYIRQQYTNGPSPSWGYDLRLAYQDSVLPILNSATYQIIDGNIEIFSDKTTSIRTAITPGHTPGHLMVEITGLDTGILITGDILHHPFQARLPDLPFVADEDPKQAALTRKAVLDIAATKGLRIASAHFPARQPLQVTRDGDEQFQWLDLHSAD